MGLGAGSFEIKSEKLEGRSCKKKFTVNSVGRRNTIHEPEESWRVFVGGCRGSSGWSSGADGGRAKHLVRLGERSIAFQERSSRRWPNTAVCPRGYADAHG